MRTEIKYGLITGVGVAIYVLIEYLLGFHTSRPDIGRVTGYFAAVIPVVAVLFAIKEKRDRSFAGEITFGQAFITGIIVSPIASFIITSFFIIYNDFINPDASVYLSQWMRTQNIPEEEIVTTMEEWNARNNPLIMFTGNFLMGLLITLVLATAIKKKKPVIVTSSY